MSARENDFMKSDAFGVSTENYGWNNWNAYIFF